MSVKGAPDNDKNNTENYIAKTRVSLGNVSNITTFGFLSSKFDIWSMLHIDSFSILSFNYVNVECGLFYYIHCIFTGFQIT